MSDKSNGEQAIDDADDPGADAAAEAVDDPSDDVVDETVDGAGDDAMFDDVEAVAAPRRTRAAGLIAAAALVAALAALSGVGYLTFFAGEPDDGARERIATVAETTAANERQIAALERRVNELATAAGGADVDVAAIERRIERRVADRMQLLESVPARVASIESALTALRGISTGARDAWLIAEAEYYMQIANAQLQLAGNPPLATLALKLADERIVQVGDPGLTDVRRALSDEIRALEIIEAPDIEGATLTLASLSRVVDSLPIRQQILVEPPDAAAADEELTGTERAVASLKSALSGVVSVRRTDEAARPLIAPDAVYFLRANLSLQLQAARLALLRGEQALFQQSLDDASAWLREYYDTESQPVRSTLQTIGEIRESSFARSMPDISESLRLIRDYIAFIEAAPVEADPSDVPETAEPEPRP